jgi:antitoxin HicB
VSKAELARRVGVSPQQAQRPFDIRHASRLDQIDAALAALGRRLVVTTEAVPAKVSGDTLVAGKPAQHL